MTKEELLKTINEARKSCDIFESHIPSLIKKNESLRTWFNIIESDIDIIPERIRDIIVHNINDLNLSTYANMHYDASKKEDVERFQNDSISLNNQSSNYCQIYYLYKSIGFVEKNTVIVGANGSGKTSLANKLKTNLNIEDGIVIPAQKLLVVPTFDNIPTLKSVREPFSRYQKRILDDKRTFSSNNNDDFPYEMAKEYGSEYRKVLALLIAERNAKRNEIIDNKDDKSIFVKSDFNSTIDTVIEIWNELIIHRTIFIDPDCNLLIKYTGEDGKETTYEAYKMSDGERIILYLVGRILLAPQKGLIIVDEPEVFLHRTVVDKLWDRLEKERNDCTFIYMTHDLQFATSRVGVKSWIKSYVYPSTWNIQVISNNEIPEQLLMELLGSCKQILFCEGTSKTSLDLKIFNVLFPQFVIYPVGSCKEVISYTKTYNCIPGTNTRAYGLVDSDFRSSQEICDLSENHIYTYHVSEIENLFLVEEFLTGFQSFHHLCGDVEKIKDGIIAMLDKNKETQCANYVSASIDYYYRMKHLTKGNTKAEVMRKVKEFNDEIKIDDLYENRIRELESYVSESNYPKVIAVYNNKGLHSVVEKEFGLRNYTSMALEYLKNAPEDVVNKLRLLFPEGLRTEA